MKHLLLLFLIIPLTFSCQQEPVESSEPLPVLTGADVLVADSLELLRDRRLGIVTNHTAVLRNGTHLVDTLAALDDVTIAALFGPEHGIRGSEAAGGAVDHGVDAKTGLPVFSLYGEHRSPTAEMLQNVDLLIFDIQDIGARFYTYISTMFNVLEAAGKQGIPVIVLDRPNPINGNKVGGPVLEPEFKSFVGTAPIPTMHGMTVGELAEFFAGEGYLDGDAPSITVIEMKNWKRQYYFEDTGLPWIKPSPNMPGIPTAIIYPGTCIFEATNINEGRGTHTPFLIFGAPFMDANAVLIQTAALGHEGVTLTTTTYTPESIEGMSPNPKYKDEACNGLQIEITDRDALEPVKLGIKFVYAIKQVHPDSIEYRDRWFKLLTGTESTLTMLKDGKTPEEIFESWQPGLDEFMKKRENYLLY